jgi:hypothetical protein
VDRSLPPSGFAVPHALPLEHGTSSVASSGRLLRAVIDRVIRVVPTVHPHREPSPESAKGSVGTEEVTELIYELLDAHDDTAQLSILLTGDPRWRAHLDYLRALQREGRETLALLSTDQGR